MGGGRSKRQEEYFDCITSDGQILDTSTSMVKNSLFLVCVLFFPTECFYKGWGREKDGVMLQGLRAWPTV